MKVTCSSVKVREKLDLLGESHDKEILDFKKMMCEAHQLVTEKEARVSLLTDKCYFSGERNDRRKYVCVRRLLSCR